MLSNALTFPALPRGLGMGWGFYVVPGMSCCLLINNKSHFISFNIAALYVNLFTLLVMLLNAERG